MVEYYFMSFRDVEKNINIGVCVIKADNENEAFRKSIEKNINPGGEIMLVSMTAEQFKSEGLEENRLYSKQEMQDRNYKTVGEAINEGMN